MGREVVWARVAKWARRTGRESERVIQGVRVEDVFGGETRGRRRMGGVVGWVLDRVEEERWEVV